MNKELQSLTRAYECALRRIRSFSESDPVLPEDVLDRVNASRKHMDLDDSQSAPSEISCARGLSIARLAITGYADATVGEVSDEEAAALTAMYQYLNGALLEVSYEIESEGLPVSGGVVTMIQDTTREMQSMLVDAGVLPPSDAIVKTAYQPPSEVVDPSV